MCSDLMAPSVVWLSSVPYSKPAGRCSRYFVSDRTATFAKMATRLLARPVELLPW